MYRICLFMYFWHFHKKPVLPWEKIWDSWISCDTVIFSSKLSNMYVSFVSVCTDVTKWSWPVWCICAHLPVMSVNFVFDIHSCSTLLNCGANAVFWKPFMSENCLANTVWTWLTMSFKCMSIIESFCHVINLTRENYKWSNQAITQLVEGD